MDVFSSFFFYSIQFLLNCLLDMTWFCIMPDQCRLVHSFPVFILISSGKPNWYPESFVDSTCEIQEENPKQRLMVCLSNAFLLFHFFTVFSYFVQKSSSCSSVKTLQFLQNVFLLLAYSNEQQSFPLYGAFLPIYTKTLIIYFFRQQIYVTDHFHCVAKQQFHAIYSHQLKRMKLFV